MIALYIVLGLLGALVLLVLAAVIRTLLTPKKTSAWEPKRDPERERAYAEGVKSIFAGLLAWAEGSEKNG